MESIMRYFNTEGVCRPDIHYMVRLDDRLDKIRRLYVDRGKYFVINRGRQYGKTTTLCALEDYLKKEYVVVSMDFQGISTAEYQDEFVFVKAFMRMFLDALKEGGASAEEMKPVVEFQETREQGTLSVMFASLNEMCKAASKPVVMMIDEVDNASNNQVFIDFLAQLRQYYMKRPKKITFHSVILAGVYDIKNLKLKLRPDEEHQYNSPWNIAANFDMDLSFSADQIEDMLKEYEADHHTGMNIPAVAGEIYQYTSGYPYLVSAICKILDETLPNKEQFSNDNGAWSKEGVAEAVNFLLKMNIPLFDSMVKQLDTYKDMRKMIEEAVYQGKRIPFIPTEKSINLGLMFCFLKEENGYVAVANRIFEMCLLNLFIAEEAVNSDIFFYGQGNKSRFIKNSRLDMDLVLEKFVEYFHDIYNESDAEFVESYGRKFFLLYLKPIINGTGNYYIEAQTRDARRTDVVVDYLGEQFVIEMKIWHGNEYNERGEKQLAEYLEYYHQKKGYMLSFNFNKKKETGMKVITLGDKTIVEAVV